MGSQYLWGLKGIVYIHILHQSSREKVFIFLKKGKQQQVSSPYGYKDEQQIKGNKEN